MKENWVHSDMWETFLIKKIKQKNFHQYFKPIKKLGKGNFASVYLAHNKKKDTLVAVKAFVK
jgi:serine/threonine protein kinase